MKKKKQIVVQQPTVFHKQEIYDGMVVFENSGIEIRITDLDLDYSHCFYESDSPSIKGYLTYYKK